MERLRLRQESTNARQWRTLLEALRRFGSGAERFTLPVIALPESNDVFCFPTLGFVFGDLFVGNYRFLSGVEVGVAFRKADLRLHRKRSAVASEVKHVSEEDHAPKHEPGER